MKILVCTDGSEQSQKALDRTITIARGDDASEVAVIYVYDHAQDLSGITSYKDLSTEEIEKFRRMVEDHKEEKNEILDDALKFLEKNNIKARAIFKEGHPARTIVEVACEEGFDMIIIGSRGLSGLKRIFLGSVSSAVVQQAKNVDVLTVKKTD